MDRSSTPQSSISRRGFLGRAALAAGAGLGAAGIVSSAGAQQPPSRLPQPHGPRKAPVVVMPAAVAQHVVYGDCAMCVIGDSICTDGSSASNIPYGMQRTWRPHRWVARMGRVTSGPPPWAVDVQVTLDDLLREIRVPGMPFSGGEVAISPVGAEDHTFVSDNLPNHWYTWRFKVNDGINYAVGDPFSGASTKARIIWWRAPGHASMNVIARRGNAEVGAPMTIDMSSGPIGTAYTDVDCGTAEGAPGAFVGKDGNQIGRRVYYLGCGVYRHEGGVRLPGFGLMQVGEVGWSTAHHLDVNRCSDANLAAYFQAALRPNTFLLHIANPTVEEINSLNAGDPSIHAANVTALVNRYTAMALLAGAAPPIRWLLVNHFPLGTTEPYLQTRARALYKVAMADPENRAFIDFGQLAALRHDGGSWYTADGVHPNPAGATYLAGLLWSQIAAAAQ